jgi:hypothetical protein
MQNFVERTLCNSTLMAAVVLIQLLALLPRYLNSTRTAAKRGSWVVCSAVAQ